MAELPVFTAKQFTDLQIAGAQANSDTQLDFTEGSNFLALAEGSTATLLYAQAAILIILGLTRASTSNGTDLDSFFADFGFPRLPATYATGTAQLIRDNSSSIATVNTDGSATLIVDGQPQQYVVVADPTNPAYNAATQQYIANVGVKALVVTVQCDTLGATGNIQIGSELLLNGFTSFDGATALAGFANGQLAESDDAYRARFPLFLRSLSRGTVDAIGAAILSVQANLTYTIANNQDTVGNFEPGNFVVTVDDGSGSPPLALINAVDKAISAYKGNTISHNTRAPSIIYAYVKVGVVFNDNANVPAELAVITANLTDYVNKLELGQSLLLSRVSNVVYTASTAVVNVLNVVIDDNVADLIATKSQRIKLGLYGVLVTPVSAQ